MSSYMVVQVQNVAEVQKSGADHIPPNLSQFDDITSPGPAIHLVVA